MAYASKLMTVLFDQEEFTLRAIKANNIKSRIVNLN